MRAVHVYPTYVRSLAEGITRNVHDLHRALDETGVDAVLDAPRVDLEELNDHTRHVTKGWEAQRVALGALEDPDVDVVHYHVGVPVTGLMARLARARADASTPLVLHVWNAVYDPGEVNGGVGLRQRLVHRLLNGSTPARAGIGGADALVVPSHLQVDQLGARRDDRPVRVIPNGVDTDAFAPAGPARQSEAREELDVHGDPTFLYYGHLSPWKGVDTLVEALPQLLDEHPASRCLLAHTPYGDGGRELRDRLEELGVRDRVRLAGVTDVSDLLAAADVAVLPQRASVGTACHPNVLLECMAGGLPVVASRVGSIPEVVDDGVHGLLVPPGDPAALGQALSRLAGDPSLRRKLGREARRRVEDRFTWPTVADDLEAFYEDLLSETRPDPPTRKPPGLGVPG